MTRFVTGLFLALFFLDSPALLADELLIFHMPGCRPCAQLKKMLDENPDVLQGFAVSKIDVTKDTETTKLFNVGSVPTVVRLDDKTREIARRVGYMSKKEMKQWLDEHNSK